jgi:hypothetical protein
MGLLTIGRYLFECLSEFSYNIARFVENLSHENPINNY